MFDIVVFSYSAFSAFISLLFRVYSHSTPSFHFPPFHSAHVFALPHPLAEKSRVIALTEDSPSEQLLDACRQGDYDEALRLITSSNPSTPSSVVDINVMDSRRWTPLFYAANRQDKRLLTLLVESRADVTRTNARGETALHRAAIVGSVPCVNTLVLCGASVDAADGHGFTPLLAAAFAGQLAVRHHRGQEGSHAGGSYLRMPVAALSHIALEWAKKMTYGAVLSPIVLPLSCFLNKESYHFSVACRSSLRLFFAP